MPKPDRDVLRQQITGAVNAAFARASSGRPRWSDKERERLTQDLFNSLTAGLKPVAPNPDASRLEDALAAFSRLGAAGDAALRTTIDLWRRMPTDRVHLLLHLLAVVPILGPLRGLFALDGEKNEQCLAATTSEGFAVVVGLAAGCAQPTQLARSLGLAIPLFARQKGIQGAPVRIAAADFVAWIRRFCRVEPNGLFELAAEEILYQYDSAAYLGLGSTAQLSRTGSQRLAELVHDASNALVLRGGPANEASLADVARAFARRSGKPHIDDHDLDGFIAHLHRHRRSSGAKKPAYDATAALRALSGEGGHAESG
jgi:hypothetical protein